MSNKPKSASRLESEIEKSRDESNWKKVLDLAEQLRTRTTTPAAFETLANFLIGESKLEQYLEENPPTDQNIAKAKANLIDAKRHLMSSMSGHSSKLGILKDAYLLLGKLHYCMGAYEEAFSNLQSAGLTAVTDRSTGYRNLRIVAESFAIKGQCLEKIPLHSTAKLKQVEREEQIVKCFETASEMALLYLQEKDRVQGQSTLSIVSSTSGSTSPLPGPDQRQRVGPVLETALQRAPILHIKHGKLASAISQYRNVLSTVESSSTQSLRLTLARQLAEVLLRGVSEAAYTKPELPADSINRAATLTRTSASSMDSPWKPKRYAGQNLFVPRDEKEEVLLLLLICEAMAVREAVLSRSPDHNDTRVHSFNNATAVYDLLVMVLVRLGQFGILCEIFDRAMKFAFEEFHIWFQFGLALASAGKHSRAVQVMKMCSKIEPNNALVSLMAAKVCFENLGEIDEGLILAQEAAEKDKLHPQNLASRCQMLLGLGHLMKVETVYQKSDRQELLRKAHEAFSRAQQIDPGDHLAEYHLALCYAHARKIPEAILRIKAALHLRNEHINSLQLLVLLLSAQKQYDEALQLIDAALEEFPDNLNLMYTKAHLEEHCCGGEVALLTSKHMLQIWRSMYEDQTTRDVNGVEQSQHRMGSHGVFHLYSADHSDRDSSSLRANSIAASRVEQALSEVASSLSSFQPKPGPQQAWLLQIQIWLLLARLYLKMDQASEATACVREAAAIFPLSHNIMYMRGQIYEHKGEFLQAKQCYQNAIAVNPIHVKSLQHLGLVYHYLGNNHLAEKTLRDAVKIDPLSHKSWHNMGKVLEAMGEYNSASECLATAIDLEASCPILPFSSINQSIE